MHDIHKKVAYLQGLMTGTEVIKTTKEGRVLSEVVTILGDVADNLKQLHINQAELESYMETIDEDLYDLENELFDSDNDILEDSIGDSLEDDTVEVQCPSCKDIVCFDSSLLEEDDMLEVTCPNCEALVYSNKEDFNSVCNCSDIEEDI